MNATHLGDRLRRRFGEIPDVPAALGDVALARALAGRASCRRFTDRPVAPELLRALAALALGAPSKSDLQQADLVLVTDPLLRAALAATVAEQDWVRAAPALVVVCGNNRRQRQVHDLRGHAFANDHLDAFFNAAVDGAIVLAAYVLAAEAAGLGACPVSGLRDQPERVSALLGLPAHVFPVAGIGLGWPAAPAAISPRLPLALTVHENRWSEPDVAAAIAAYDARRRQHHPYRQERDTARFGHDPA